MGLPGDSSLHIIAQGSPFPNVLVAQSLLTLSEKTGLISEAQLLSGMHTGPLIHEQLLVYMASLAG